MNSFFYRLKKLIGNLFTFFFKIKSNRHKNYRCSKELLETMNSNRFSSINESSFNWSSAFLITQCVFYFLLVFINKILRYHLNHDSIKSLNSFSMYFLLILFFYSNRSAPCLIEIKNWHFPSFSYVLGLFIFHLWKPTNWSLAADIVGGNFYSSCKSGAQGKFSFTDANPRRLGFHLLTYAITQKRKEILCLPL